MPKLKQNQITESKAQRKAFNEKLKTLRKSINDYVKAKRGEARIKPVYLAKDSDYAVDKMRDAFEWFIRAEFESPIHIQPDNDVEPDSEILQ